MSLVKQTVIGLALVYAVAVPAVAEGLPQPLSDYNSLVVSPTGTVTRVQTNQATSDMIKKMGTPMTTSMIIHMRDGQVYSVQDQQMPDGQMLSDKVMKQ